MFQEFALAAGFHTIQVQAATDGGSPWSVLPTAVMDLEAVIV